MVNHCATGEIVNASSVGAGGGKSTHCSSPLIVAIQSGLFGSVVSLSHHQCQGGNCIFITFIIFMLPKMSCGNVFIDIADVSNWQVSFLTHCLVDFGLACDASVHHTTVGGVPECLVLPTLSGGWEEHRSLVVYMSVARG